MVVPGKADWGLCNTIILPSPSPRPPWPWVLVLSTFKAGETRPGSGLRPRPVSPLNRNIGKTQGTSKRDDLNPRRISKQVDLASLQRSPRAPQVLGDDDRLQVLGRFYVYVSLSRDVRRCEDALRLSALATVCLYSSSAGLSRRADGARPTVPGPSALHHRMITHRSTGSSPYCSSDPLYATPRQSPRLHDYLFPYWSPAHLFLRTSASSSSFPELVATQPQNDSIHAAPICSWT
ncbi:hypothetical protein C8R46DRAFT_1044849 [Mycena filopes]|nr:hypothetical protein C8R46DRAFT_1044849 [Mycena filopes]